MHLRPGLLELQRGGSGEAYALAGQQASALIGAKAGLEPTPVELLTERDGIDERLARTPAEAGRHRMSGVADQDIAIAHQSLRER